SDAGWRRRMWSGIWRSDGAKPEKIPADASRAWTAGTRRLFCGRKSGVGFLSAGKGIRPKMAGGGVDSPFSRPGGCKRIFGENEKKAPGDGDGPDDPAVPPDGASFLVIRGTPPDGPVVHLV